MRRIAALLTLILFVVVTTAPARDAFTLLGGRTGSTGGRHQNRVNVERERF